MKLDKTGEKTEAMHILVSLTREEKFGLIQIFTGAIIVVGVNPRGMVAITAVAVRIHHKDCRRVTIFKLPNNITSFCQGHGRGPHDGQPLKTLLLAGIFSYLSMIKMPRMVRKIRTQASRLTEASWGAISSFRYIESK